MKVKYPSLLDLFCKEIPHKSPYFTAKTTAKHALNNYKRPCFTSNFEIEHVVPKLNVEGSSPFARFETRRTAA